MMPLVTTNIPETEIDRKFMLLVNQVEAAVFCLDDTGRLMFHIQRNLDFFGQALPAGR